MLLRKQFSGIYSSWFLFIGRLKLSLMGSLRHEMCSGKIQESKRSQAMSGTHVFVKRFLTKHPGGTSVMNSGS